jgi:hypothetical protein
MEKAEFHQHQFTFDLHLLLKVKLRSDCFTLAGVIQFDEKF